jgi:ubiquinone/menaquinone biosynthesis C-methylase UbiE
MAQSEPIERDCDRHSFHPERAAKPLQIDFGVWIPPVIMPMSNHQHWQLDGRAAELYQRYLVPAITPLWAADLIDRVAPKPGERALDIACGTGAVTRLVAERAPGRIVGLNFNPGMLAMARFLPSNGAPIEWFEGNVLSLPVDDNCFNLVLCQLGLQFFPDKRLAVREMRRVLTPVRGVALRCLQRYRECPRPGTPGPSIKASERMHRRSNAPSISFRRVSSLKCQWRPRDLSTSGSTRLRSALLFRRC